MTQKEFEIGMKRLAAHYPDRLPNDVQRLDYFEFLGYFLPGDFKRAIDHLTLIYKWKTFPPLSEIVAALDFILDQNNPPYAKDEELSGAGGTTYCQKCDNTGYELFEKKYDDVPQTYTTARPCSCSAGKRRADGLRQYFLKLKYKSRLVYVRPEEGK